MTALSAAKDLPAKEGGISGEYYENVAASTTIYAGALVMILSTGYATNAAASASNKGVAGVAMETVDNSAGSAGDKKIKIRAGRFQIAGTGFSQASVGSHIYASDNATVSTTQGTNEPLCGTVDEYISSTSVYAQIGPIALVAAG